MPEQRGPKVQALTPDLVFARLEELRDLLRLAAFLRELRPAPPAKPPAARL